MKTPEAFEGGHKPENRGMRFKNLRRAAVGLALTIGTSIIPDVQINPGVIMPVETILQSGDPKPKPPTNSPITQKGL